MEAILLTVSKDKLREKYAAKIVVVILHLTEIEKVMNAILPELNTGEFVFLATAAWGRRQSLLEAPGRTKLAGSLVLSQEIVIDRLFERYFR